MRQRQTTGAWTSLIHVEGDVGSGKTLFAVRRAVRSQRPVFTNTPIHAAHCHMLDLATLLRGEYENCMVILDEAYNYVEARASGQKLNRALSYILFQSRKSGLTIITTEQELGTLDIRFRTQCKYLVECVHALPNAPFSFHITRFVNARAVGSITRYLTHQAAAKYFSKYDTYKKIDSLSRFDDVERLTATPERKLERAEDIASKIKSHFGDKRVTHARLNSYFELHSLPRYLRETVWTLLCDEDNDGGDSN